MTGLRLLACGSAAFLAGACLPSLPFHEEDCARVCDRAARCGVLPSALGGEPGDTFNEMVASCVRRCTASQETTDVTSVLKCLTADADADTCAVETCVAAGRCLQDELLGAVVSTPEVTFRLINGAFWTLLFQPQLCDQIPPYPIEFDPADKAMFCTGVGDPCPLETSERPLQLPLCTGVACVYGPGDECDPRLCWYDFSPSSDCALMGVESVQFGYFDESNTLHLDAATYTCAEAAEGQIVSDIRSEVIYPVAIFNGEMSSRVLSFLDLPPTAAGNPFCWLSYPSQPQDVGWFVHGGPNLVPVPSPNSAWLASAISGDPGIFPRGCNCQVESFGCEDVQVNANCDNQYDDDSDGLVDAEDPGCAP